MDTYKKSPQKKRACDEVLVPNALRYPSTGPECNEIAGIEQDEKLIVLILSHLNILKNSHGTGLGESRLVKMYQEGNPPCLDEQEPEVFAYNFPFELRSQRSDLVFVLVVEYRRVIGIPLVHYMWMIRRFIGCHSRLVVDFVLHVSRP